MTYYEAGINVLQADYPDPQKDQFPALQHTEHIQVDDDKDRTRQRFFFLRVCDFGGAKAVSVAETTQHGNRIGDPLIIATRNSYEKAHEHALRDLVTFLNGGQPDTLTEIGKLAGLFKLEGQENPAPTAITEPVDEPATAGEAFAERIDDQYETRTTEEEQGPEKFRDELPAEYEASER